MKRTLFTTLLLLNLAGLSTIRAQETALITDVKISFFTPARTDDKDANTQITATLYTAMGKKVASLDKCCGNIRYPDANYTSSTYQLGMRGTASKTEIQSGYFDIHIDPAGNDKWVFMPILQITFSDGSTVTIKGVDSDTPYTKRLVTQDVPDTSFPFHL